MKHKNSLLEIKMGDEILTFGDIEIEKINFTAIKALFFKKDVNIKKVLVSKKILSGDKKL